MCVKLSFSNKTNIYSSSFAKVYYNTGCNGNVFATSIVIIVPPPPPHTHTRFCNMSCNDFIMICKNLLNVFNSSRMKWKHTKYCKSNVLFNDAINALYLRLYSVGYMAKDHSHSERGNPLPPHGLLFPISSKGYFRCTTPLTAIHISRSLLHQPWSTG